ncbi:MAG: hypothetical protein Rubg2KO_02060 [Rubricoccaceae bacterium]
MRSLLLLAIAMVAAPVLAQTSGSCVEGTAQRTLDASNVQASLFTNGNLFFGGSTTSGDGYLVPKLSRNSPMFAAGIWLSGTVNDEIRVSAARYGRYLFRPGPLNDDASLPSQVDCLAYDRIWVVSTYDVSIYQETGVASSDLAEWPVGLGAPTVDANGDPVEVTSRDQGIDLAAGERPVLSGTQTAFWVMNDVAAQRGDDQTAPLGVEVQVTAFVTVDDELAGASDASFYRFRVINRSTNMIENARFSFFSDADLGDAGDDYMGTDTTRSMRFIYNSDEEDAAYGIPPAIGFDLLSGLAASSEFSSSNQFGGSVPSTPEQYYNHMQGRWSNGSPYYEWSYGFEQPGRTITSFMYSGDPVTESFWSQVNTDSMGTDSPFTDRIGAATADLERLAPGDTAIVDLGILFAQGTSHLNSITELRSVSDGVQAAYEDGSLFQATEATELLARPDLLGPDEASTFDEEQVILSWTPIPDATLYRIAQSLSPTFAPQETSTVYVDSTSTFGRLGINETQTFYWRVRAESPTRQGPFSETRSYTSFFYRYIRGVTTLADGSPAYVEVSGPGGVLPCDAGAQSTDGCDEVGGNLIYESLNSTGEYYLGDRGTGSETVLSTAAPNEIEIRFTEAGGLAYYRFQEGNIVRVPFEVWDIGIVLPGDANDPADDVRLIPVLFADNGGTCAFDPAEIPSNSSSLAGYTESDRIYAYYAADTTSYDAYEAAYGARVDADADGCLEDVSVEESDAYTMGQRPIQRQVFGSLATSPKLPGTGTVVRMYTTDPRSVADEDGPRAGDLTLGPAYPNPTASSLTVPYRLASSSAVELAVYDVLGRQVIELVNTRQPEGRQEAVLDASALAPGVYVVRLRAGDETRTTRITVVR